MCKTPNTVLVPVLLAAGLYLTAPIVEWFYYTRALSRGHFPVNADSIAIPLGSFFIGWLLALPLAVPLLWIILSSYPGSVSLFGFNSARPYWSFGWSLVFAYLIYESMFFAVRSAISMNALDVMQSTLLAYLFLCLRSSIIYGGLSLTRRAQHE